MKRGASWSAERIGTCPFDVAMSVASLVSIYLGDLNFRWRRGVWPESLVKNDPVTHVLTGPRYRRSPRIRRKEKNVELGSVGLVKASRIGMVKAE